MAPAWLMPGARPDVVASALIGSGFVEVTVEVSVDAAIEGVLVLFPPQGRQPFHFGAFEGACEAANSPDAAQVFPGEEQ